MIVLLECINEWYYALSYNNCYIRVHRSFITIFYKLMLNSGINIYFTIAIMLALCLTNPLRPKRQYSGFVIKFVIKKL